MDWQGYLLDDVAPRSHKDREAVEACLATYHEIYMERCDALNKRDELALMLEKLTKASTGLRRQFEQTQRLTDYVESRRGFWDVLLSRFSKKA